VKNGGYIMPKIYVLYPMTVFMSQNKLTNEENYHLVPLDRNGDNPFYIVPELETETRFYWTGFDSESNSESQFSCFKKNAFLVDSQGYFHAI